MLLRKIVTAGPAFTDTDWLDPALSPPIPDNARRFRILDTEMRFALRGRADSTPGAADVDLGAMTVDAYVLIELRDGGLTRGKTIIEVELSPLDSQIYMRSTGLPRGLVGRLHLDLAVVSAPVIDVLLLDGGRPL